MASSAAGRVVESSSRSPAISVVVTTIPTSTSQTACVDPIGSEATRNRFSQIKLVGVGGLERQNYCCGHWFPTSKSYHRHLAEKAFSDINHETKLLDLGMVRCAHCSMWVHSENIVTHLAKSHSINNEGKASKVIPVGSITEVPGLSGESLLGGTNIVIKVTGHNTARSFSSDVTKSSGNSHSKSGTVKLVTTSSSTLYQKLQNIKHSNGSGAGKVIVHKPVANTLPMINVGPRIVMKSVRQPGVGPLGRNHKMIQQVAQSGMSSVTGVNGVAMATTLKVAKKSHSSSSVMSSKTPLKAVVSQSNFHNITESLKLVKSIAPETPEDKSANCMPSNSQNKPELSQSTKTKEKNKILSSGESSPCKTPQGRKGRKQVLKPSTSEIPCTELTTTPPPPPPPHSEGKVKKRGRKPKLLSSDSGEHLNSSPNHKGQRRKFKETLNYNSYTPKMVRQPGRGIRGGWKKKRGPGRPRKNRLDETPDTSELDSLFDEMDKEDLENEPLVVAKKEEENIPTVELDLFTLPSTSEQVSVLLTEPQNPNFKVYASMDAIFVGDSALGDVTNQIGYVTDANNVVYVNPSHFLFPNVEDLENFVPSPILTMKGNKAGLTPARKPWSLGNKVYAPVVLKQAVVNASRDAVSSDVNQEKVNQDEKESPIPLVSAKTRVEEHVLKTTQSGNTVQEWVSSKKEAKPPPASNSFEAEAPGVMKESQNSTAEISPYTKVSKKRSHKKKKKRQKSISKSGEEIENNVLDKSETSLLAEREAEIKPVQVVPKCNTEMKNRYNVDAKNRERQRVNDSLIQKCVVKIEELKYPLKLEKSTTLSEHTRDAVMVKSPKVTTKVSNTLSHVKVNEKSPPQEEVPVASCVLKSDKETDNLCVPETDWKPSPSVEKSCKSSAEDAVVDVEKNASLETKETCARVTEASKVVCRTMGGGLPRRMRRRRLRTKSANIVSSITDSMQELGGVGGNRRVRHVSESSVLLNRLLVTEQKKVSVDSQNERTGGGHSPKRKLDKVKMKTDSENAVYNSACPQTPQSGTDLPSSTSQEKTLSDYTVSVPSISPISGQRKRVKMHSSRHEDKAKTLKVESPCVEVLKPIVDVCGDVCSKQPSTEVNSGEKFVQGRSVRERRPSFKFLESFSVASQSPKRSPQSRPEGQLESPSEQRSPQSRPEGQLPSPSEHGSPQDKPEEQLQSPSEHRSPQSKPEGQLQSPSELTPDKPRNTQQSEDATAATVVPDSSPSREWLGRGAKLKAQVLIQDQQAGVMDSQIYPPNDSPKQTSGKNSSIEPPSFKQRTPSPSKMPHTFKAKSPSPAGSCKAVKSPTIVQNREWQARGAKLKAQVMISDPESSLVPYIDAEEIPKPVTSPPMKKIKLDSSPGTTKDIRLYFRSQKSPLSEETATKSPSSPLSPQPLHPTKKIKRNDKSLSDIRSYFSSVSPVIQSEKGKVESIEENTRNSPKKLISPQKASKENPFTLYDNEDLPFSVEPLPISECTFEGFKRVTRQSGLRSRSLLRLVSLFNVKNWYHLDRFPFPVDQLCDWDDELLNAYDFD